MEYKLKSHKDKLLIDHLSNVADSSRRIIQCKSLNLKLIDKKHLANISYLIGIAHDFGKTTKFFQEYLQGGVVSQEKKTHSPISSYFGYLILKEYCNKNNVNGIFSFIGAFLIKKHHGNLDWIDKLDAAEGHANKFNEQLSSMPSEEIQTIYESLLDGFSIDFLKILSELKTLDFENFFFDEVFNKYQKFKKKIDSRNLSYELFLITELLFSVLVDCDKKDAAGFDFDDNIKQIPIDCVQKYLEKKKEEYPEKFNPDLEINKIKNELFDLCVNNPNLKKENKIYSITAPTGGGKTLTSFATALKLKSFLNNNEKYRVHYVLPFTTIIDQNYGVFRDVLKGYFRENNENDYIIKHHYLTIENLKKQTEDNKDYKFESYMDELLFIKSWNSSVVVSSYVQLLETIVGGKNSFMNKFHNIVNSIIILDEVQCISSRYWDLFRGLFNELAEKFNVYFIFLTATQPLIFNRFENKDECRELAKPEKFSKKDILDRVEININLDEKNIEEFFEEFCKSQSFEDRYLFILNTKRSSLDLYNKFKNSNFKEDYEIVYLSTNLTPFDRKQKLNHILGTKKKNSNEWEVEPLKRYIVITTQLVEAGVDISSDVCYRDFAPIDSIIQSAGRVNRFGELFEKGKKGKLFLINLRDEKKSYSNYVYDCSSVLRWTRDSLNETKDILKSSKDFILLIDTFYNKAIREDGRTKQHFEQGGKKISSLNFNHDFKFINEIPTHSIFILNNYSKNLIEEYKKTLIKRKQEDNKFKWIGELKKIRKKMQSFIVNIRPRDFKEKIEYLKQDNGIGDDFYYIDTKEYPNLYNSELGFNLSYEQDNII